MDQTMSSNKFLDDEFSEKIDTSSKKNKACENRTRKKQLKIYLSEEENAHLQKMKDASSRTTSYIVRSLIMGSRIPSTIELQVVNELRRQGGLLKHVAYMLGDRQLLYREDVDHLVGYAQNIFAIAREIQDDIKKNTKG